MADQAPDPTLRPDDRATNVSFGLTPAEYDALVTELHDLRRAHQSELADRLRDARAHGSPADNDDVLAVHEEAVVHAARIARLEELLSSAPIIDREFDGCASLGCSVRVTGDGGRIAEYVLIGRRDERSGRREVSLRSPVGRALLGARPGQVVRVQLPGGRDRELRILDVTAGGTSARKPVHAADAAAA